MLPDYSETYTFYVNADDSARLWVNGVLLFDKWDQCCQERQVGLHSLINALHIQ